MCCYVRGKKAKKCSPNEFAVRDPDEFSFQLLLKLLRLMISHSGERNVRLSHMSVARIARKVEFSICTISSSFNCLGAHC